jgi:hypothetical protein
MALQAMNDPQPVEELWLPQFKLEQTCSTSLLKDLTKSGLQSTEQSLQLQLYSAPQSDGTPVFKPAADAVVINESFVLAITNSKISDAL